MSQHLFVAIQDVTLELERHSGELLQGPIPEEIISDKLSFLLRGEGYRTASRVNLWKFAANLRQERNPANILKTFLHPLQPDVDLLIEDHNDGNKLWGFEIKLIRWENDPYWHVIPKGRFYDGLGQALALTTFGFDYVCLWHIFIPSREAYRRAFESEGLKRAEQLEDDQCEFFVAYSQIMRGIIENFNLPIGYVVTGLWTDPAVDQATERVLTRPLGPWKRPRALELKLTGSRIRVLLQKAIEP